MVADTCRKGMGRKLEVWEGLEARMQQPAQERTVGGACPDTQFQSSLAAEAGPVGRVFQTCLRNELSGDLASG